MAVYQMNVLDKQGETLLSKVPVHLDESDRTHGSCILWGEDCHKLVMDEHYKLSFQDKGRIDCIVTKIDQSPHETSATVEFSLAPQD